MAALLESLCNVVMLDLLSWGPCGHPQYTEFITKTDWHALTHFAQLVIQTFFSPCCCVIHCWLLVNVFPPFTPSPFFSFSSQSDQCRLLLCRLSHRIRCPPGESEPCPADGCHLIWDHAVCCGGIHHPQPPSCGSCHTRLNYCLLLHPMS